MDGPPALTEKSEGKATRNTERQTKREREKKREKGERKIRKNGHWNSLKTDFLANSSAYGPVSQEPSNHFRANFGGVLLVASHHGNTNKRGPPVEYFGRDPISWVVLKSG